MPSPFLALAAVSAHAAVSPAPFDENIIQVNSGVELVWAEEIQIDTHNLNQDAETSRISIDGAPLSSKMEVEISRNLERIYKENPDYMKNLNAKSNADGDGRLELLPLRGLAKSEFKWVRGIDVKTFKMDFSILSKNTTMKVTSKLKSGGTVVATAQKLPTTAAPPVLKRCVEVLQHDLELFHLSVLGDARERRADSEELFEIKFAGCVFLTVDPELESHKIQAHDATIDKKEVKKFKGYRFQFGTTESGFQLPDFSGHAAYQEVVPGSREFRSWLVAEDTQKFKELVSQDFLGAESESDPPNSLNTRFFETYDRPESEIKYGFPVFVKSKLLHECRPPSDAELVVNPWTWSFEHGKKDLNLTLDSRTMGELEQGPLHKGLTARSFLKKIWRGVFQAAVQYVRGYETRENKIIPEEYCYKNAVFQDTLVYRPKPEHYTVSVLKSLRGNGKSVLKQKPEEIHKQNIRDARDRLTNTEYYSLKLLLRRMEIELKRCLFGVTLFNVKDVKDALPSQCFVVNADSNSTSETKSFGVSHPTEEMFRGENGPGCRWNSNADVMVKDVIYKILQDWFCNYTATDFQNVLKFEDLVLNGKIDDAVNLLEETCWLEYCDFHDGLTPLFMKQYNELVKRAYKKFRVELKQRMPVAEILRSIKKGNLNPAPEPWRHPSYHLKEANLPTPTELLELLNWLYANTDLAANPYCAELGAEGRTRVEKYEVYGTNDSKVNFNDTVFAWVDTVLLGSGGLVERIEELTKFQEEELRTVESIGRGIREKGREQRETLKQDSGTEKESEKSDNTNSTVEECLEPSNSIGTIFPESDDSYLNSSPVIVEPFQPICGTGDNLAGGDFKDPVEPTTSTTKSSTVTRRGPLNTNTNTTNGDSISRGPVRLPVQRTEPRLGPEQARSKAGNKEEASDDDEDGKKRSKKGVLRSSGGGGAGRGGGKPETKQLDPIKPEKDSPEIGSENSTEDTNSLMCPGLLLAVFVILLSLAGLIWGMVGGTYYFNRGNSNSDSSSNESDTSEGEFDIETGLHPRSLGALERAGVLNSESRRGDGNTNHSYRLLNSNPGSGGGDLSPNMNEAPLSNPLVVTSGQGETGHNHSGSSQGSHDTNIDRSDADWSNATNSGSGLEMDQLDIETGAERGDSGQLGEEL